MNAKPSNIIPNKSSKNNISFSAVNKIAKNTKPNLAELNTTTKSKLIEYVNKKLNENSNKKDDNLSNSIFNKSKGIVYISQNSKIKNAPSINNINETTNNILRNITPTKNFIGNSKEKPYIINHQNNNNNSVNLNTSFNEKKIILKDTEPKTNFKIRLKQSSKLKLMNSKNWTKLESRNFDDDLIKLNTLTRNDYERKMFLAKVIYLLYINNFTN